MQQVDLKGKVAVVTGGAKGIGNAYCRGLARSGAAVVVADIDQVAAENLVRELTAEGAAAMAVVVDVASSESVQAMAQAIAARFGQVDILVNNAALFVTLAQRLFWEIPDDEWDKVMDINIKGVAMVTKYLLPLMRKTGAGKIINIASGTVLKGRPTRMHYVASKGAVIAISRVMARELGQFNINVNTIAPGQTVTETYRQVESEEYFQKALGERALKRVQEPKDLVGTMLFLCSSASDYMTGQILVVDGGAAMV